MKTQLKYAALLCAIVTSCRWQEPCAERESVWLSQTRTEPTIALSGATVAYGAEIFRTTHSGDTVRFAPGCGELVTLWLNGCDTMRGYHAKGLSNNHGATAWPVLYVRQK